jgi:hypothetical protein
MIWVCITFVIISEWKYLSLIFSKWGSVSLKGMEKNNFHRTKLCGVCVIKSHPKCPICCAAYTYKPAGGVVLLATEKVDPSTNA